MGLTWSASTDNVGVTGYRVERCQGAACTNFASVANPTGTSYGDGNLTVATSYTYRVRATDAAGNLSGYSNTATSMTSATAIYYIQGANQTPGSGSSVSATYSAAQGAGDLNVVVVGWGDSTSSVTSVTDSQGNTYVAAGAPTVSSGNATQVIYYAKNIASAAVNAVTVTFSASVPYPDLRIVEYSGVDTVNALDSSAGTTGVGVSIGSGAVTTTAAGDLLVGADYIEHNTVSGGSGSVVRMLDPDGQILEDQIGALQGSNAATATQDNSGWWIMQAAAFRVAGNSGGGSDTQSPTAPTSLTANAGGSGATVALSWGASTDNVGVAGYKLDRCQGTGCSNFAQIATPTATSYNDTGLAAGTTYQYRVLAVDAAGNASNYSNVAGATTAGGEGGDAPTTPANPKAGAASNSAISLSWNAATDPTGVTGYLIEECQGTGCTNFTQVATVTGTSYNIIGLAMGTTYTFRVRAVDGAGNISGYSTVVSAPTFSSPGICD
jgi:chitodextrinase